MHATWDQHVACGSGSLLAVARVAISLHGLSLVGIVQGIAVGVGVFVATTLLKKIRWFR